MCNCSNRNFKIRKNRLYGEYDGDFHQYDDESYSFCPICGENLQPERSKREDSYRVEYGTDIGISFLTSEGVKKMEAGKKYDQNLNEI